MNLLHCELFLIFEQPFVVEHDHYYRSITITKDKNEAMYSEVTDTIYVWCENKLHRTDGPAIITKRRRTFYLDGVRKK